MVRTLLKVLTFVSNISPSMIRKHNKKKEENNMPIKTKALNLKDGDTVRSVKVTESNVQKVAEWLLKYTDADLVLNTKVSATGTTNRNRIRVKTKKGWRVANIGDTVIRYVSGIIEVIKANDFANRVQA